MAIVDKEYIPAYQWAPSGFMTWTYRIHNPRHYLDDELVVRYVPNPTDAFRIYINEIDMEAHAPELGEAQDLAILLFKLHYTNS
jgi:hypothetical protein